MFVGLDWDRFVLGCVLLRGLCVSGFVFGLDCVCWWFFLFLSCVVAGVSLGGHHLFSVLSCVWLLGCAAFAECVAGGHPAYLKYK